MITEQERLEHLKRFEEERIILKEKYIKIMIDKGLGIHLDRKYLSKEMNQYLDEYNLWNNTIEFFDKINVEEVLKEINNE